MRRAFWRIGCALTLGLTACAAIEKSETVQTEKRLAAAGFQMQPAETPEQIANVNAMPQRKLAAHERDGQVFYVYADGENCRCLYVGSQEAYQRYQKLAIEQEIARDQMEAAAMEPVEPLDWDVWGRWEPGY